MNLNNKTMCDITYVIWGAGIRGRNLSFHIRNQLCAYIDSNENLIGQIIDNVPVISFEEYLADYGGCIIIVSTHEDEIEPILLKNNIGHYFLLRDCPEDFSSSNPRNILKNHVIRNYSEKNNIVFLGFSLFSILIIEWLHEIHVESSYALVIDDSWNDMIKSLVRRTYTSHTVLSFDDLDFVPNEVYVTVQDPIVENIPSPLRYKCSNIFLYSEKYSVYLHAELSQFKAKHFGERCFIVATGPSLTSNDLDTLLRYDELCISFNSIYKIFNKTKWRPDYYISADSKNISEESIALDYLDDTFCLIADNYEPFINENHKKNVFIYHTGMFSNKKNNLPYSSDITKIIYSCATAVYPAIQLSTYMGIKEIYLIGVDATGINQKVTKYGHFHDEDELVSVCYGDQVSLSYNTAFDFCKRNNIKIYNATRGGQLEIFPRVDFDSLF